MHSDLLSWESCYLSFHFWDGEVIYSGNGLLLLSLECAWAGEVLCLHLGHSPSGDAGARLMCAN